MVREHHAPVGALRPVIPGVIVVGVGVREHHAPVGALRPRTSASSNFFIARQGAPRTCRCIETKAVMAEISFSRGQGAPRTCRCIETPEVGGESE